MLKGRSHCPTCNKTLRARDLVPVFSYLFHGGKCGFCKDKISVFYPILELSMAGLFTLTAYMVGVNDYIQLSFYLFIAFIFVVLTFYDFLYQEVPDQLSLPAIVVASAYMLMFGDLSVGSIGLGFLVPVLFFGALHFGSQGRWLGGGDIRIGALMGVLLGWPMILIGLFLGYLSGSIYSMGGLALRIFSRKSQIPFVPFLLLGCYIAMFWGEDVLRWYTNFL